MSQDITRKEIEKLRKKQRQEENLSKWAEQAGDEFTSVQHEDRAYRIKEQIDSLKEKRLPFVGRR